MNRADCELVDIWLDDWVAGRLHDDFGRRIATHVRECDRCRRLEAIVRDAGAQRGAESPAGDPDIGDLSDDVLSRTSGSPCGQAEMLLPALVDGELDTISHEIVASHLGHCDACARLAAALQEARDGLPALAELEPPPGFTELVLVRTSRAQRASAFAEWWMRLLLRPRASLELAYVGAILIVILVGNPVIAFRGAEEHARRFVGSVPVDRIAGELPAKQAAVGMLTSAVGSLMNHVRWIGVELSNQWLQARAIIDGVWDGVVRGANWLRTLEWKTLFTRSEPSAQPANKAPPKKASN